MTADVSVPMESRPTWIRCEILGPEVNVDSGFCRSWEPSPVQADSMPAFSVKCLQSVEVFEGVNLGRGLSSREPGCTDRSGVSAGPLAVQMPPLVSRQPRGVTSSYRNKGSGGVQGLPLVGTVSG